MTQTVGYGTLYYAFAVFLVPMAAGLHASTGAITGAFTASVLTSAALAVPVGRWLDRHGGRALMTGGSLLGAILLAAWSQVHALWQLYLVEIGIGAAAAASLYEAAFAVIIAGCPPRRRPAALLTLTVVAGFASTVFLPLTGWLVHAYGWRTALLLLATIQAGLTVPLHAVVLRPAPSPPVRSPRPATPLREVFTDRAFWLLTVAFTANTAAVAVVTVHLVAALIGWGHPATFAATTAGLFGVLSVTGRLVTTGLQRRYRTIPVVAAIFALQGLAAALLPLVGRDGTLAVLAVVGFGLGFGVATIAKPVLLAERYDTRRYATIAGAMVVPVTVAKATAPLGAAWLASSGGGYAAVFAGVGLAGLLAATALLAARDRVRPSRPRRPGAKARR
ncbi:MFS transporter [Actinoplanes subtropicus]|uniref:MFS transporter n=1 Tax=Actinoplanes subtropicus TaxID=543632 RepID=UPI0024809FBD|nr:MFS transporter [Actinoplanes subtropicus]